MSEAALSSCVTAAPIRVGNVVLNQERREVQIGATHHWQPSPKLFALLALLMRHAGRVLSRDRIMGALYADAEDGAPFEQVIAVMVSRLRRNLERGRADIEIRCLAGEGYVLDLISRRPHRDDRRRRASAESVA